MQFDIVTIFPKMFESYLRESLFRRAFEKKIISIRAHNLRDYSRDRHKKVDGRPFGGGPGMVIGVEPIYWAVLKIKSENKSPSVAKGIAGKQKPKVRVILFSARGKVFEQKDAKRLSCYDRLVFICGRYEGIDERVAEHIADEEISIGNYILSGGELPAMVLIEAICRYVPDFLGKKESLEDIRGSYSVYTRPAEFKAGKKRWEAPKVLLSGNHAKIRKWRAQK